jgi:hypothetical protein
VRGRQRILAGIFTNTSTLTHFHQEVQTDSSVPSTGKEHLGIDFPAEFADNDSETTSAGNH